MSRHVTSGRPAVGRSGAALALAIAVAVAFLPTPAVHASACWLPPVTGVVDDPFREPPCPYCAGNRGIEYRIGRGVRVRSVAAGTVTFAGSVAGTRYVVVRLGDGRRVTYGRLTSSSLSAGDRVAARSVVGIADDTFHLGVRVGNRYVDPGPLLGRLVGRPRLVPIDGSRARTAPPLSVRCGGVASPVASSTVGPGSRRR